ncbi:hypothetical protein BDV19DRAFT_384190 [Aspergillus venezuelensis]
MHIALFLTLLPCAIALTTCTSETVLQRKEWSSLASKDRIAYNDAIICLMNKPSIYDAGVVPASTSYYTDFAAAHANVSLSIHQSGTFLSWHREFLHLFESALHTECDYPSDLGIPYWDWPLYTDAPLTDSTLFDGSPDSLGGNGAPIPNRPPHVLSASESVMINNELTPGSSIPLGSGGGCVVTGPFANTTVSLGPFPAQYISTGLPNNWTEPNPHCISRDLNDWALDYFTNSSRVTSLLATLNITSFQFELSPIHRGGHISIGGQMADFYVSPLEPAFWLHHAQIDRLWDFWQKDGEGDERLYMYNGTSTFQNPIDGTPEVRNETEIEFWPLSEEITLREASGGLAQGGRYFYQYV